MVSTHVETGRFSDTGPSDVADEDSPDEEGTVRKATSLPGRRAGDIRVLCRCPITDLRCLAHCSLTTSAAGKITVLAREKHNHFDIH